MHKSIIVTGGAQGIGRSIAEHLHSEGYSLAVMDNDREALDELGNDLGRDRVLYMEGDVSSEDDVRRVVAETVLRLPVIWGVVNNAAVMHNTSIENLDRESWDRVLSVNLTGAFLMSKHAAEHLRRSRGSIVNIASTRALMSEAGTEAYSASKGGLLALTHALAMSLAPDIRVNAVSPGWIETGHLQKKRNRAEVVHSEADRMQHPAGRVGETRDVAAITLYLLSENAGFITGQNFVVDGGMTRKMIYV